MAARALSSLLVLASAWCILGCGPTAGAGDAGLDAGLPDAPRPDVPRPSDSVTFHVVRGATAALGAPAAGCAVSIVAPGPRRYEGMADDAGVVTLGGFEWGTDGRISATFFSPEHTAYSISGFSRADYEAGLVEGRFEIFLPAQGAPTEASLNVTGTALGFGDPMNVLYAQPTLANATTSAARGAGYAVRVPPGVAFRLLLTELSIARGIDRSLVQPIAHWALTSELGPLTADLARDVDLVGDAVIPSTTTASFVMPDAPFFLDASSEVNVVRTGLGGEIVTGLPTMLTVGADGRSVDVTLSLVDVPGITDGRTVVSVSGTLGSSSSTLEIATPAGVLEPRLLTPPSIDMSASRPLFAPVPVGGAMAGLESRVRVEQATGELLWTVAAPLGASTVAMPALPFETMLDALGTSGSPVYLVAQLCELASPTRRTERCVRSATSARVLVAVP